MKFKEKFIYIFLIIVLIATFSYLLINQYRYSKIEKEELITVTEVFSSSSKSKSFYEIMCESGKKYKISQILADDEHIDTMSPGDNIVLSIEDNIIIELEVNGQKVLNIDDCHQKYQKQFKVSAIVFPIIIIFLILLAIGTKMLIKKTEMDYHRKFNFVVKKVIDENVYKNIQDSIYIKNGYFRCNILEQIESDDLIYTFYMAMLDYLPEREIVLLIEDGCSNDELSMIFYKDNKKLYFEQIFRDGQVPFEIDKELFWYFPFDSEVTKEEQIAFNNALSEYITFNSEILKLTK